MEKKEKKRQFLRILVMKQLDNALNDIEEKKHPEYVFFKAQDSTVEPEDLIYELVEVGLIVWDEIPALQLIKDFYQCSAVEATLLYRLTDAEQLMYIK